MNEKTKTAGTRVSTKTIAMIALMAALICVLGPLSISIGVVPISLTNFAIYITVYVLGWKKGTVSYLIYLALGAVGLPVFSSFSGGLGKIVGPTGGYLVGFIFIAILSGLAVERFYKPSFVNVVLCLAAMVVSTAICYLFGTVWFVHVFAGTDTPYSFSAACAACVWPFIPGDLIKIIVAAIVGPQIKKALISANLV